MCAQQTTKLSLNIFNFAGNHPTLGWPQTKSVYGYPVCSLGWFSVNCPSLCPLASDCNQAAKTPESQPQARWVAVAAPWGSNLESSSDGETGHPQSLPKQGDLGDLGHNKSRCSAGQWLTHLQTINQWTSCPKKTCSELFTTHTISPSISILTSSSKLWFGTRSIHFGVPYWEYLIYRIIRAKDLWNTLEYYNLPRSYWLLLFIFHCNILQLILVLSLRDSLSLSLPLHTDTILIYFRYSRTA